MLRRLGLGRSTVVDAAEPGGNSPAGSLAENPGETERSAAEFGGAPRDRDRGEAAAATAAREGVGRGFLRSWLPTSRGNAAASAATASAA
ncbi:hypothetical protein THAOC_22308, partial [Thalassiosira oceanica]